MSTNDNGRPEEARGLSTNGREANSSNNNADTSSTGTDAALPVAAAAAAAASSSTTPTNAAKVKPHPRKGRKNGTGRGKRIGEKKKNSRDRKEYDRLRRLKLKQQSQQSATAVGTSTTTTGVPRTPAATTTTTRTTRATTAAAAASSTPHGTNNTTTTTPSTTTTTTPAATTATTTTTITPEVNNNNKKASNKQVTNDDIVTKHGDKRRMIYDIYMHGLRAPPPDQWETKNGVSGTVTEIKEVFKNFEHLTISRRMIRSVISEAYNAHSRGVDYNPELRKTSSSVPDNCKIKPGTDLEMKVADFIEAGLSIIETAKRLNQYILDTRGSITSATKVGKSAVASCIKRMTKLVYSASTRPQGSSDVDAVWSIARRRWAAQILLRLGVIEEDDDRLNEFRENGVLPKCFQKQHLTPLDWKRVGFFDEVHRKALLGFINKDRVVQFPRDKDGKYDPDGEFDGEKFITSVKFAKEMRMMFGVATNEDDEGVRLQPFDYTEKNIETITKMDDEIKELIKKVKNMSKPAAKTAGWVVEQRDASNKFYLDDPLTKLDDFGGKTAEKLATFGLTTVGDLRKLNDEELLQIETDLRAKGITNVKFVKLRGFRDQCLDNDKCIPTDAPPSIDHRKHENPFLSKYGAEEDIWGEPKWKVEAKKEVTGKVCVTELVKHMVIHTQKLYSDDNWWFYHDALSQLTSKSCIAWMKATKVPNAQNPTLNKTVFDHWVHSEHDLNKDCGNGRFDLRPPGNSAELMPLDNSLNRDLHTAVNRHVVLSNLAKLPEDTQNQLVFSVRTPKQLAHAYKRIFDPVTGVSPPRHRIEQDIAKTIDAMQTILSARGVYVPGLAGGRVEGRRGAGHHVGKKGGKRKHQGFTALELSSGRVSDDGRPVHEDIKHLLEQCGADVSETSEETVDELVDEMDEEQAAGHYEDLQVASGNLFEHDTVFDTVKDVQVGEM